MDNDYIARIVLQAIDQASPVIRTVAGELDMASRGVSGLGGQFAALDAAMQPTDARLASLIEKQQLLSAGVRETTGSVSAETVVLRQNALAAAQSVTVWDKVGASYITAGSQAGRTGGRIEQAGSQVERAGKQAEVSATQWASATSKLKLFELGSAGVIAVSTDMAMKFEQSMEMIHTEAGAPQSEVDALSSKILTLSNQVAFGPNSLSQSLYHAESAGFRSAAALDIVKASAEGARVGNADLESSTQAVIAVMSSQISGVRNAGDAMAYLNGIVGIGDMKMQGLTEAMSTGILPTFKTAGLGIQDFGAALAVLTDNATPPIEAATRLRMTVALLAAPSGAAAKSLEAIGFSATEANNALKDRTYLEQYGIHVSQLSADLRQPNGLLVALEDLKSHLEASGLTATEQAAVITRAFGGGRSSGAIQTLLGELDKLKSKYGELGASASEFGADVSSTHKTMVYELEQAKASSQALSVTLGQGLAPAETAVLQALTPLLQDVAAWTKGNPEWAAGILLVAGGIGALALGVSTVSTLVSAGSKTLQILGLNAASSTPEVTGLGAGIGAAGAEAAIATPQFTLLSESIAGIGTVAQTTSGLLIPASAAIEGAGAAAAASGAEAAAAAPGWDLLGTAIKGATILGLAYGAAEIANNYTHSQNEVAIHKIAQAYADGSISAKQYHDLLQIIPPSQRDEVTALVAQDKAQRQASQGMAAAQRAMEAATGGLKTQHQQLQLNADAWDRMSKSIGGVPWHSILGLSGGFSMSGTGSGPPRPAGPYWTDLQAAIKDAQAKVQNWANIVEFDRQHNHAALAGDMATLESHRQTLTRLQKEEDSLTSVTKAVHQALDPLSVASKAQSDAAKQIQSDYSLLGYALPIHIAAYEKATDTISRLDLVVSNITANAEYRKYGAPQQAVSSSIASLQNQSALVGQNTSLSSQDKATSQGQLQVLIDLKTIALDHLKLDQLRKEHAPQSQIAAAQATLTGDTYKLGQDRLTVTADISAGDLARLESHFQVLESADTSKIAQLQHQSAMIGLNTQLTSEQKAVLQAGLQVQIDLKQIALDTLKLQAVLADPHHTASDVAAARGQLDSDANKLQEDQASLRNARATDEATKAIQKWTLETSQHSQKSEEALDALALGIRNHDTPAQLEKLALAAASAQSLVNGDGTAHQKAADMVTKLLDPGLKLAGVFKQIADSGQSAADYLTKTFGRQGMDHSFGYGAFSATGGQLVNAGTTTKIDNANIQITGLETTNSLLQQQITATNNDTSLTAEQKAVQVATLQLQIDHNKLVEDNWKLLIATLQKDPGAIASAQGQIKIDTAQQGNDQGVYSTAVKNLTDLSSVTADLTTYFLTGKGNFEQLVAAGKADIAADTAKANAAWLASYALAGMSDKATMLAQKFQPLISQQSSQQSAQSGVDNANLQVISANSAIQVGLLTAQVTATQDLAGLATANAGVDTARFNLQLARINDGTSIMQAIASNDATLLATQRTISQDQASGNTVKEALDRQLLAAQQKSGADAIAIAKATAQMDQAVGMAQLAVARDQAKEAADKILVDQRNADAAGKLALDALAVANDGVDVARASQAIQSLMAGNQGTTNDLLNQIISTLGGDTSGNDPSIAAYGQKLGGLLETLSGVQTQLSTDQKQQTIDQGSANVIGAQGSLLLAGDQSQTSGDQTLATKVQQMWELSIAQMKATQAGDQVQEQKIQAELSNINSSVQTVNQTLQQTKSLLNDLKGLSRQGLDRINVSTHTTEQILDGVAHQVAGTVSAG